MRVLGIETSCDETAAAVVDDGRHVASNVVLSQIKDHMPYGGVVPEIASRLHVEMLPGIVEQALRQAGADWNDLDGIAVTRGPGLSSSLLIGLASAKALALRLDKPLIGINHLDAHLYSVFLSPDTPPPAETCPMVTLLVSGGHTLLVETTAPGSIRLLGETLDDAAGEALDKGATLMGLSYPGGPAIERAAQNGRRDAVEFPRGLQRATGEPDDGVRRDLCFSFSGVKTALLYYLKKHPIDGNEQHLADVAASYQEAVFASLVDRLERAAREVGATTIACVGGVARNKRLRGLLDDLAGRMGVPLLLAKPEFCTDNAAMIAALAGTLSPWPDLRLDDLDADPNLPVGE